MNGGRCQLTDALSRCVKVSALRIIQSARQINDEIIWNFSIEQIVDKFGDPREQLARRQLSKGALSS